MRMSAYSVLYEECLGRSVAMHGTVKLFGLAASASSFNFVFYATVDIANFQLPLTARDSSKSKSLLSLFHHSLFTLHFFDT